MNESGSLTKMADMHHDAKVKFELEFGKALSCSTMVIPTTAQFMAKHKIQSGWCTCAKLGCLSLNADRTPWDASHCDLAANLPNSMVSCLPPAWRWARIRLQPSLLTTPRPKGQTGASRHHATHRLLLYGPAVLLGNAVPPSLSIPPCTYGRRSLMSDHCKPAVRRG